MGETAGMAFGQQSGPPATAKQVSELLSLLQAAGHSDFRDARGPLGLTQRQAGGKFTREEADAFISALHEAADTADVAADVVAGDGGRAPHPVAPLAAASSPRPRAAPGRAAPVLTGAEQALRRIPTDRLAAELQRRGWIVVEP